MRKLAALLAGIAATCLLPLPHARAQPSPALVPQPLPIKSLFPLEDEQCGCFTFRQGDDLQDDKVIFSVTPAVGRIKLNGREREVRHQERKRSGQHYTNTYRARGLVVWTNTAQAQFAQACAAYPDPPPHGSCYTGTMTVQANGSTIPVSVVQVCGC